MSSLEHLTYWPTLTLASVIASVLPPAHDLTMANAESRVRQKPPKRWSMHPSRHEAVSDLLEEARLHFDYRSDDESDCERAHDTNIMGWFICFNQACRSSGWSSKKIAITIRMYPGRRYNAKVYHQRCNACNWLGKPKLDGTYEERVAYRLKAWSGIKVERPTYAGKSKAPHRRDLCEGCRVGHCSC